MAITRTQQAKQLLNKVAPKGEKLAYINDKEAKLLKKWVVMEILMMIIKTVVQSKK